MVFHTSINIVSIFTYICLRLSDHSNLGTNTQKIIGTTSALMSRVVIMNAVPVNHILE